MSELSQLLEQASRGDSQATSQIMPLVYDELRRIAQQQMDRENSGHTLTATGLVHEVYCQFVKQDPNLGCWSNRAHFFCAASEAMRRILIDNARRKQALKHGGGWKRLPFDSGIADETPKDDFLLELNEGLTILECSKPRVVELVKLRFFAGLTLNDAAELLQISPRTAKNWWAFAKAWLQAHFERTDNA